MRRERGNTLVGMLATVAIIMILMVGTFYGSGMLKGGQAKSSRADGKGKTIPGLAKLQAEDTVCRSNLNQVRMALEIAHSANGEESWPTTLQETKIGSDFYSCPLGKEPYTYDPETGKVSCPHPGHEKY